MFDEVEWASLVTRLISLSKDQVLKWEMPGNDAISLRVGAVEYEIGSVDRDGRAPFFLSVTSLNDGRLIGKLESSPVESNQWGSEVALSAPQMIIELRTLALRVAQNAPQVLSKLISDLDDILPF